MKNIIKKVVIVAILVMMLVCLCGFTNQKEDVSFTLEEKLTNIGYTKSEVDPNCWTIIDERDIFNNGAYVYYEGIYYIDINLGMIIGVVMQEIDSEIIEYPIVYKMSYDWTTEQFVVTED